jgi:hypothetical protein
MQMVVHADGGGAGLSVLVSKESPEPTELSQALFGSEPERSSV